MSSWEEMSGYFLDVVTLEWLGAKITIDTGNPWIDIFGLIVIFLAIYGGVRLIQQLLPKPAR